MLIERYTMRNWLKKRKRAVRVAVLGLAAFALTTGMTNCGNPSGTPAHIQEVNAWCSDRPAFPDHDYRFVYEDFESPVELTWTIDIWDKPSQSFIPWQSAKTWTVTNANQALYFTYDGVLPRPGEYAERLSFKFTWTDSHGGATQTWRDEAGTASCY